MSGMRWGAAAAVLLAALGGCQEGSDDGIRVDATGAVAGIAWVDRNGNGVLEPTDGPAGDVRVELVGPAGSPALYSAETNPAGEFVIEDVLVGDYLAVVDTATVGDSLRVLRVDSAAVTVTPGDVEIVVVGLTYPTATTDSARAASVDSRVFIVGRVISEWGTFGEATLHVRDSTGALRAVRVAPTGVVAGDSVRLFGTVAEQAGQPVLKDVATFLVQTGLESPAPVLATTAEAASAAGGELDAELVRVQEAVIQDTLRNALGELVFRVDDGSGPLDIVLDRDIPFFLSLPAGSDVIGTEVDARGILVPPATGAAGEWVLKPRENADLVIPAP